MGMRIEGKEGMDMPTTYAHYQFGKDVIRILPGPLQKAIENHRELFDIGLYGPDIFFYYRIFHKNRVNAMSNCGCACYPSIGAIGNNKPSLQVAH